jgi:hypothetical protein
MKMIRPADISAVGRGRLNLRFGDDVLVEIDLARSKRAGNVSRNTWIAEAIAEKLDREHSQLSSRASR